MVTVIVSVTESTVSWELGFWAYLGKFILTEFIEIGRTAHCRWPYSLAGVLNCVSGETELFPGCEYTTTS